MNTTPNDEVITRSFSDFIRNASAQEKQRVFTKIIKNVAVEQQEILVKAKQSAQNPALSR